MNVEHIIDMARQVGASDVHLVCGLPVKFRLAGCPVSYTHLTLPTT